MKKSVKKQKGCNFECKLKKTLGIFSAVAIAGSLFMGYNRLTGNVVSAVQSSTTVSLGGVALFILGLIGVLLIAKD
jgi:hypothetical protein